MTTPEAISLMPALYFGAFVVGLVFRYLYKAFRMIFRRL